MSAHEWTALALWNGFGKVSVGEYCIVILRSPIHDLLEQSDREWALTFIEVPYCDR